MSSPCAAVLKAEDRTGQRSPPFAVPSAPSASSAEPCPERLRALDGAAIRFLPDAWLWARTTSTADVTPLVHDTPDVVERLVLLLDLPRGRRELSAAGRRELRRPSEVVAFAELESGGADLASNRRPG